MRAIGYFRTKSLKGNSINDLESTFREYCVRNMHQPIKVFASIGTVIGKENEEYLRMLRYIQSSGSEFLLVVSSADQLGTGIESVVRSIIELEAIGVTVVCSDEELPDPIQNAFHTLGVKGVSQTRSRRIKQSMMARALKGQALGRPLYGYTIGSDGKLEIVQEEAKVVKLIYRLYIEECLGLRLIARQLNENQIRTRRGGNWNVVSLRDILRNISYTGTYTRYGMRRPKVHQAIITSEVFRAAQDLTKARRPRARGSATNKPFLLSKELYCSYCGNKMMGVTRRQSWKRKDGRTERGVYRYYQCQSRNNQSVCGYHTWKETMLDDIVLEQLKCKFNDKKPQKSYGGTNQGSWHNTVRESNLIDAERRFLRVMKEYALGKLDLKVIGKYLSQLDVARDMINDETGPIDIRTILKQWDELNIEDRRMFLSENIECIVVKDNEVDVKIRG